jgi:hypothetical protein
METPRGTKRTFGTVRRKAPSLPFLPAPMKKSLPSQPCPGIVQLISGFGEGLL